MKKFIVGFLSGALLFGMIGVYATTSYVANIADFKVIVNGEEFVSDPPALVVEGRTYLPLRAMGDALGVPVEWNEDLRQAEVGNCNKSTQISTGNQTLTNDKWSVTFTKCETMTQIDEYTKASDGQTFLIAYFDVENISNEEQTMSLLFSEYYVDDIKERIIVNAILSGDYIPMTTLQVAPHKKAKGYIALEVPTDWKKFEFIYNEDLLKNDNSNAMKFIIER